MAEKEQRLRILEMLRRGDKPAKIKKELGASYSTIQRVRLRQDAERETGDRRKPVVTPLLVRRVRQRLDRNPRTTISKLARDFGVSRTAMSKVVKEELGCRSYKRPRRHNLTNQSKVRRLVCAKGLLNKLKHEAASKSIIFSDEKFFTLAQYSNRQNDKLIWRQGEQESAPDELRNVGQVQRAAGAMFLGVVGSDGKVAPPIWVPPGIKINSDAYVELLCRKIKPWIDATYAPGTWVFQQDGAPAHTSKKTQDYLRQEGWCFWAKEEWPPHSPDLAPLDYSIWDRISGIACKDSAPSIQALKRRVNAAWRNLDASYVRRVCRSFRRRLELVIGAEGGRIED